jgi:hypothetical protein
MQRLTCRDRSPHVKTQPRRSADEHISDISERVAVITTIVKRNIVPSLKALVGGLALITDFDGAGLSFIFRVAAEERGCLCAA